MFKVMEEFSLKIKIPFEPLDVSWPDVLLGQVKALI